MKRDCFYSRRGYVRDCSWRVPNSGREIDMTEKAQRILDNLNRKNRKTPTSIRDKVLQEFNTSTLDDVGPVAGGDQEIKMLKEMNELESFQNENWSRGSV